MEFGFLYYTKIIIVVEFRYIWWRLY